MVTANYEAVAAEPVRQENLWWCIILYSLKTDVPTWEGEQGYRLLDRCALNPMIRLYPSVSIYSK